MYRLCLRRSDDSQALFAEKIPVYGIKKEKLKRLVRRDFDKRYIADRIISIGKYKELPCRCLKVKEGSSFIVNDFVVHNSGVNTIDHYRRHILPGFNFRANKTTGSKEERSAPFSSMSEAKNISLVKGQWIKDFLDELEVFPSGKFDDQVDAASGAFEKIALDQGRFDIRVRRI
jgi:phage terminase large subunit-like protein